MENHTERKGTWILSEKGYIFIQEIPNDGKSQ